MTKKKIAVVGSGFAAWGAAVALAGSDGVELHVFDIGLTRAESPLAERPVANAKKCDGSFFCYGINDPGSPVRLESERMCSSHALGGHSTVYSGAILYPLDADLAGWPRASIPRADDYAAVLGRMPLLHEADGLDAVFPSLPTQDDLSGPPAAEREMSVVGMSRIAAAESPTGTDARLQPFSVGGEFAAMAAAGVLRYTDRCYVTYVEHRDGLVHLFFGSDGDGRHEGFDAVFLGAGCVNTTAIVDRSLGQSGSRTYAVRAPRSAIHAFLRFPWKPASAARLRQRNGLPELFLEVRAPGTGNAWGHTQLTGINDQIVDAICSRVPRFLHGLVGSCRHVLYFALSAGAAGDREVAVLRSAVDEDGAGRSRQVVSIEEHPTARYPELVRAVRRAVFRHWRTLRMVPFPFGEQLADFFRRNRLGGWHFGGTLPMREHPNGPAECLPSGQVAGLRGVYVLDSAAFSSVPASTVALLTAANAHRVARCWKANHIGGEE
jgi:hypothetical protein